MNFPFEGKNYFKNAYGNSVRPSLSNPIILRFQMTIQYSYDRLMIFN